MAGLLIRGNGGSGLQSFGNYAEAETLVLCVLAVAILDLIFTLLPVLLLLAIQVNL